MTAATCSFPPNGTPGGCRAGATTGVDPAQNRPGAGRVLDDSTASPVVAPDGSIFYGVFTRYNYFQGHLMKFSPSGAVLAATLRLGRHAGDLAHDGTYSVITKDNHYSDTGSYCDNETFCPSDRTANNPAYPEAYFITQLSPNLHRVALAEHQPAELHPRQPDGNVTCVNDHPHGFECCVNAPAVDRNGTVYANSEDGNLYVIRQGGTLRDHLFLELADGAAYTPLSIGSGRQDLHPERRPSVGRRAASRSRGGHGAARGLPRGPGVLSLGACLRSCLRLVFLVWPGAPRLHPMSSSTPPLPSRSSTAPRSPRTWSTARRPSSCRRWR